ncbi:hypothetical protein TUM4630_22310 [Shewanella algidipiscicola]|uniref:Uncharacterized protein n=1 Tax=Shewanella algidipiscicola TaxID=614070 RepID=A0ABQ4PJ50_9GAMM|nr:hypothetical protein TUM4630_22310 [Shewanella algidipiscicola]
MSAGVSLGHSVGRGIILAGRLLAEYKKDRSAVFLSMSLCLEIGLSYDAVALAILISFFQTLG